jgi:2-dehydropantoate 2-reductase
MDSTMTMTQHITASTAAQQYRHGIMGAGLIGGYLAAHLAPVLSRVIPETSLTVIGRGYSREDYGNEMAISDFASDITYHNSCNVMFYENVDECIANGSSGQLDVLWLTVKCTAIEAVVEDIKPLVHPGTVIICCQNGIGSDVVVRDAFPEHPIYRAMFPFNVVKLAPGHFHRGSSGTVMLENMLDTPFKQHMQKLINGFMQQYSNTFPCAWCTDMDALLWAKCQVNLTNSVNALSNLSLKDTLLDRGYRQIIAKMMREHLQVCDAMGIRLPKITKVSAQMIPRVLSLPNWLFQHIAKSMVDIDPEAKLSMWWDIEHHRKTEIDYINGATIKHGKRLGIPTPMNQTVLTQIKILEEAPQRYLVSAQALQDQCVI